MKKQSNPGPPVEAVRPKPSPAPPRKRGEKGFTEADLENLLSASMKRITGPAFDLIQADPHSWSSRPCSTCKAVSALIGRPFGCVLYAINHVRQSAR
jgi:hypothetical protein